MTLSTGGLATFGPYVVESTLGSGGMGVVYRARDTRTDRHVALKVLRFLGQKHVSAFRREVHVLARLRHPSIVRIVDQGLAEGKPWYAMELIEGRTLAHVLKELRATGGRPPLHRILALVTRLCRTLSFLHVHGIVHRDLKPENVLVRDDETPVLVDFGIVARFGAGGRETLDYVDVAAGTLPYMAPEQRHGRFVDARADLFSLGCIIYEALTGRLPFGRMGLHGPSEAKPALPSSINPDVPNELDELVLRLLAKQPRDRFGYADDVESAVSRIWARGAVSEPVERATYLYHSDLAGRDAVLRRLEVALDDARSASPVHVVLSGESGVGKTRLVMELAARAGEAGMTVVTSAASPIAGERTSDVLGAPLYPLRELLLAVADACRAGDAKTTARLLGDHAKLLALYEPGLAAIPGFSALEEPPRAAPSAARARLFAALKSVLVAFAQERPLVVVIDDVQWADELTTEFLATLDLRDVPAPLAVVCTYRMEESSAKLRELAQAANVHEVLGRFDREAVERMVGGMLGLGAPPSELIDFVHRESSGNPFFVSEYLRATIREGLLDRGVDGRWALRAGTGAGSALAERVSFPESITALISRRLDDLDDLSKRAVVAAAVLARGFDVELVARAAELSSEAVLDAYGTLRQRQILEDDADGTTRFVHDRLREIVYERVDERALPELHRRAAAAIEDVHAAAIDPYLGVLAMHYARAGEHGQAGHYFERAGDHARRQFANDDAARFYSLALAELGEEQPNGPAGLAGGRLREAVGDLLLLAGKLEPSREQMQQALAASASSDVCTRARRRRKVAQTWERQHQHVVALAEYAAAEADLGEMPGRETSPSEWWREWVQIQVDKAWDLYFLARVDELGTLVARTRTRVEQHAEPGQRARFLQVLAQNAVRRARYSVSPEILEFTSASLRAAEESGDRQEIATAQFSHGFMLLLGHREREASPLFEAAVSAVSKMGDRPMETRFLSYLAVVHRRLGRIDEAVAAAERSRSLAADRAMFDYVGVGEANLAWAAFCREDFREAERQGRSALATWSKLPPVYVYPLQWLARMPLLATHLAERELDAALDQAAALLEDRQHLLPSELGAGVSRFVAAPEGGAERILRTGRELVSLAREYRYL